MPLVKSEVLSQDYYFYPWPEECDTGTCGRDLFHINYSTDIVLWAPMDSFKGLQKYLGNGYI
jgi:hypothetical protein